MKLFGFNKKTKFRITEPDRNWVEDNFKWLIQVYGYPNRQSQQITISDHYFPKTFSSNEISLKNLSFDLCQLLDLDSKKIVFEIHEDLRDSYSIPYEIEGIPFETEIEILESKYKIHIAKSIVKRSERLVFSLIYEFIKVRLFESKLQFDTGEDNSLFIFIAGIYFGLGIPLSQNLTDRGRVDDGFWETKWSYVSEMPSEVMAFSLATYSKLIDADSPEWSSELPRELRSQFENAITFLKESPASIFDKAVLEANDLFAQSYQEYKNNDFASAISTLQKILFLTEDERLKADVFNNIGYYLMRSGDFGRSIVNFQKALEFDPDYGFAYDNLGYALIQIGKLEEGKRHLDNALKTDSNDDAYTNRNYALYYVAKGENDRAKESFKLAFESETDPVDLLALHYGDFLLS
ncbi:MAG: hypothetical protein JXR03_18010 [Cyclobacteriaceae bacterium]